jgi:hypothetical protein
MYMMNVNKNFHTSVNKSCTVFFFGYLRFTYLLEKKEDHTAVAMDYWWCIPSDSPSKQ